MRLQDMTLAGLALGALVSWGIAVLLKDALQQVLLRARGRRHALAAVLDSGAQVILTATEAPAILTGALEPVARFHVERGELRPG